MDAREAKKQRRCLRCQRMFLSQHAGNRICPRCTANPPNVSGLRHVALDGDIERITDDNR